MAICTDRIIRTSRSMLHSVSFSGWHYSVNGPWNFYKAMAIASRIKPVTDNYRVIREHGKKKKNEALLVNFYHCMKRNRFHALTDWIPPTDFVRIQGMNHGDHLNVLNTFLQPVMMRKRFVKSYSNKQKYNVKYRIICDEG